MTIDFQSIAKIIQNDLEKKGIVLDREEIISRVKDLSFYGRQANSFDYLDFYFDNYYPQSACESIIECGFPVVNVDSNEEAANDEYYLVI